MVRTVKKQAPENLGSVVEKCRRLNLPMNWMKRYRSESWKNDHHWNTMCVMKEDSVSEDFSDVDFVH